MTPIDERPPEAERVTDAELAAVMASVRKDGGYRFERIQDSYRDNVPRAVFVDSKGELHGVPLTSPIGPLMLLVGRLAAEVVALRSDREVMKADLESTGEALLLAKREASEWQTKCNSAWAENGALRVGVQDLLKVWDSDAAAAAVAIIEELRKLAGEP